MTNNSSENVNSVALGTQANLLAEEETKNRVHLIRKATHYLLEAIGEDTGRAGLFGTPDRMVKAWAEWCSGYACDPAEVLKTFDEADSMQYDQMIVVSDIPVYSQCEHHMAPIFGTAAIGYVPKGSKVVGLSKLSRVVDIFARRLQVQERLTTQIADAIQKHLEPQGVAVVIKARHMCMESRGINRAGTFTTTSALHGCMREQSARAEFLRLAV